MTNSKRNYCYIILLKKIDCFATFFHKYITLNDLWNLKLQKKGKWSIIWKTLEFCVNEWQNTYNFGHYRPVRYLDCTSSDAYDLITQIQESST